MVPHLSTASIRTRFNGTIIADRILKKSLIVSFGLVSGTEAGKLTFTIESGNPCQATVFN